MVCFPRRLFPPFHFYGSRQGSRLIDRLCEDDANNCDVLVMWNAYTTYRGVA